MAAVASLILAAPSASAQEADVQQALIDFDNQFLPNVRDYQSRIEYPQSNDNYFAWASLVVAVGEDAAIILSAGQSEAVVKVITSGISIVGVDSATVDAARGRPVYAAVKYAAGKAVDKGLRTELPRYAHGVRCNLLELLIEDANDV